MSYADSIIRELNMIDPAFAVAFAGKVAKSNLLQDVRDGVVNFLAEKAKDVRFSFCCPGDTCDTAFSAGVYVLSE